MSFVGIPTRFLDFGAVKINSYPKPVPCTSNAIFCQPTEQTDDIAFQFIASESSELLLDGDFSNGLGAWGNYGWFINDDNIPCHSSTMPNAIYQNILAFEGYYKIIITVTGMTDGVLFVGSSTATNGISVLALTITANGTYTVNLNNTQAGAVYFLIQATDIFDGCISYVSVREITVPDDYTVQIIDHETSIVLDTVTSDYIRIDEKVITVQFKWSDFNVTNGCRVIRILDSSYVFEDNFDTDPLLPWTLGEDITISGGDMTFAGTGAACSLVAGFECGAMINTLVVGESYTITYTVQNVSGATVTVLAGLTQGTTRTVNGTYTETLKCTSNGSLGFFFNGNGSSVEVDTITVSHSDNIDGQSECYDLQDSHDCSLMFEWSNAETWGNFDYSAPATGNAFVQKLRLISKFRGTKYPSTKLIGETSAGVKSMDYSSLRKKKILDIDFAPDYIHDAMAAMWVQDTRTIGGVSYILEDDYEPSAPSESRVLFKDMMTARIELGESTQEFQINRNI